MEVISQFRRLLLTQVMLGILAFCIASENFGLLLVAGGLVFLSWYIVEGPAGRALPNWVTVCGGGLAAIWLIYDLPNNIHQRNAFVLGVGYFTMALQVLLLFGRKSNREYGEILILSLVQLIGASVLSQTIVYGLLLATYCGLAIFTVLVFQIKITGDLVAQRTRQAMAAHTAASASAPALGREYRRQFRGTAVGLGLSCSLIGVVVFIAAPRHEGDLPTTQPMLPTFRFGRQMGYTNQVELNTPPPDNSNDNDPVLLLTLTLHGRRVEGDQNFHLRGAALDLYNISTATWSRSPRGDAYDRSSGDVSAGIQLMPTPTGAPVIEGHVTLRHATDNTLFVLFRPVWIRSSQLDKISYSRLDQRLGGHSDNNGVIEYDFRSILEGGNYRASGIPVHLPREDNYLRDWNSPRADDIRRLTLDILHDAGLDRDPNKITDPEDGRITAVLAQYLRTHYTYSLTRQPIPGSVDPIYDFLTLDKRGHCELFAAALTAMARSIGITSRMVTGYLVSEYSPIDGYYVARQANAHAWVEVFCEPGGWREIDPTPAGNSGFQGATRSHLALVREIYDHVQFLWFDYVVAYNERTRARIFHNLADGGAVGVAWVYDAAQRIMNLVAGVAQRTEQLNLLLLGLLAVGVVFSAGSGVRYLLARRRAMATLRLGNVSGAARQALARRLGFFIKTVDLLERHGLIRPAWQTPMAYAQTLADEENDRRLAPLMNLTEIFYQVRFGGREVDAATQKSIEDHYRQLAEVLRRPSVRT